MHEIILLKLEVLQVAAIPAANGKQIYSCFQRNQPMEKYQSLEQFNSFTLKYFRRRVWLFSSSLIKKFRECFLFFFEHKTKVLLFYLFNNFKIALILWCVCVCVCVCFGFFRHLCRVATGLNAASARAPFLEIMNATREHVHNMVNEE